ncbi:sporulation protein YqfD [Massiliimalia timonensis]|uniref:sporulation protein YqfD n=1 Tax=Massiliimalia timonensis TaxID=1987501 RepID=UPI00189EF181|nr:sporulation protein YqfD [Massiliimalia timonensis]
MYLSLIRRLKGFVDFQMSGTGIEETLNQTASQGVKIWRLIPKGNVFCGCISSGEYRGFAGIARKNGTKVRVVKKYGAPFYWVRLKRRKGILVGAGLCCFLLLLSQNFLWSIEIHDYGEKDRAFLTEVMEDYGIHVGAYLPGLDCRLLQQQILMEVEDISWMALNRKGTVLEVEVSEKVIPPEIKESSPCNIIAKRDGQVVHMEVYGGKGMVEEKEAVSKGDLLVSGITENDVGIVRQIHADAKVVAQTHRKHTITFDLHQEEKIFLDQGDTRYAIEILGVTIPLYVDFSLPFPFQVKTEETPVSVLGNTYPVSLVKEQHQFYQTKQIEYTKAEGEALIQKAFQVYEQEQMKEIAILSFEEKISEKDGKLSITREYLCEEDIAAKMQLSINETPKN